VVVTYHPPTVNRLSLSLSSLLNRLPSCPPWAVNRLRAPPTNTVNRVP